MIGTTQSATVRYHVRHDTVYHYEYPVRESHQLLRLFPRAREGQRCVAQHLGVTPEPNREHVFTDAFGNGVRALYFEHSHESLSVRSECWIELDPRTPPSLHASPPWEAVRDTLRYQAGRRLDAVMLDACAFLFESTDIRIKRSFADYALESFTPERPLLAACDALMRRIHDEFIFDASATEVSTPVTEVFANRRGVCQDFAHFMISCLRSLGLSARYVSGYLLTRPPPGKRRLIGADATHAWVSVFVPQTGWLDLDPTNALWVGQQHVTIGWGRDFSDVSPMRGVLLGGGGHEPEISVTMVPEDEFANLYTDAALPGLDLPPRAG